jgi:hypothetical protein
VRENNFLAKKEKELLFSFVQSFGSFFHHQDHIILA